MTTELKQKIVDFIKSNDMSKNVSSDLPVDLYRGICLDFKNIFNFPLSERDSLMGDHTIFGKIKL